MQTTFAVLGHLVNQRSCDEEDIQLAKQLINQMQLHESHQNLLKRAFSRGKATDFPHARWFANSALMWTSADLLRLFLHVQSASRIADSQLRLRERSALCSG